MAEYRRWKKIEDEVFRIIAYYKDHLEDGKRLEYADVLKDISDDEYKRIEYRLLEQGYKIMRDFENYNNRRKIRIGHGNYSYFTIEKTKLRKNYETIMDNQNSIVSNLKEKVKRKHNERGAGRKPKATKEQIESILNMREQGLSYRQIAQQVNLAVGTIFNLIKKYS